MTQHSFHNDRVLRVPSTLADPLPSGINTALYSALLTIEFLYSQEEVKNFVVITHRDPDADAFGVLQESGALRDRSLKEGEPLQVSVRGSDPDLPVRAVAKLLSQRGGGGPSMGAASLNVPPALVNTKSPEVFLNEAREMVLHRLLDQGASWESQNDPLRTFLHSTRARGL